MRMSFGKYKGQLLADIPTSYLQWIAENVDGRTGLVREAEEQLLLREGKGVERKDTEEVG